MLEAGKFVKRKTAAGGWAGLGSATSPGLIDLATSVAVKVWQKRTTSPVKSVWPSARIPVGAGADAVQVACWPYATLAKTITTPASPESFVRKSDISSP